MNSIKSLSKVKKLAMIPARMGSKRVPNKNLRMIDGKPLISFIIEAVIESGCFEKDEIFINSESEIFKKIAEMHGVNFYKRDPSLSTDEATNDDFAKDFIEKTGCDVLFQFLSTSPFLNKEEISKFVNKMIDQNLDTLISIKANQIECIHNSTPINFDQKKKTPPSQSLNPIFAYACGMMSWRSSKFLENMKKFGAAYHGGDGKTGFFEIKGFSTVDIDTVEDFELAEVIYSHINRQKKIEPRYFDPEIDSLVEYEEHVPSILGRDGVTSSDFDSANITITKVREVIDENKDKASWLRRVVNTENNSCCLISQQPGEGNRLHFHPSWNEWWYIVDGEWDFEINNEVKRVVKDDIVFIPRNTWHKITAAGNKPAVRLAVSREDVKHGYKTRNKNS